MSEPSIFDRYPEMTPIDKPPAMATVNRIGSTVYGNRDRDPETSTYVKTHLLRVCFIPFFALSAYRVFPADNGGWYFLGRVPLSRFARRWNYLFPLGTVCLIAGLICFFSWQSHKGSPEYKAGQQLAEADRLVAQG